MYWSAYVCALRHLRGFFFSLGHRQLAGEDNRDETKSGWAPGTKKGVIDKFVCLCLCASEIEGWGERTEKERDRERVWKTVKDRKREWCSVWGQLVNCDEKRFDDLTWDLDNGHNVGKIGPVAVLNMVPLAMYSCARAGTHSSMLFIPLECLVQLRHISSAVCPSLSFAS